MERFHGLELRLGSRQCPHVLGRHVTLQGLAGAGAGTAWGPELGTQRAGRASKQLELKLLGRSLILLP